MLDARSTVQPARGDGNFLRSVAEAALGGPAPANGKHTVTRTASIAFGSCTG